jgi:hypothetical protein
MKNNSINKESCNGNIVITMNKILKAKQIKCFKQRQITQAIKKNLVNNGIILQHHKTP